jgi:hypothetical protein
VLSLFFGGLNNNLQTQKPSKVGAYPSDLNELGCETNGKTRPVVPVTVPRPETAKRTSFFMIFENCKSVFENKMPITIYPFIIYPFPDVQCYWHWCWYWYWYWCLSESPFALDLPGDASGKDEEVADCTAAGQLPSTVQDGFEAH